VNVRRGGPGRGPGGGLGRGLGALIPTAGASAEDLAEAGGYLREVPLDAIAPNPRQPRGSFDDDTLAELAASIREVGLLQPIIVREQDGSRYELVMGERRWRAARLAGLQAVPAIVRTVADSDLLRDALLENLHREQLNALEEAAAYAQLLDDFSVTHEALAERVGKSRSHVSNTLRLLGLTPPVQRRVAAGVLSAGHARALLGLAEPAEQEALAARIVAEGLSVRAVEEIVAVGAAGEPRSSRRARGPRAVAPGLADLADRLSERFETRVRVDLGRAKGKIIIEFATVDDLERLVAAMAPGLDVPMQDAENTG
jgi:ParB family transcriptional regulator, chromosome partitioning protein